MSGRLKHLFGSCWCWSKGHVQLLNFQRSAVFILAFCVLKRFHQSLAFCFVVVSMTVPYNSSVSALHSKSRSWELNKLIFKRKLWETFLRITMRLQTVTSWWQHILLFFHQTTQHQACLKSVNHCKKNTKHDTVQLPAAALGKGRAEWNSGEALTMIVLYFWAFCVWVWWIQNYTVRKKSCCFCGKIPAAVVLREIW